MVFSQKVTLIRLKDPTTTRYHPHILQVSIKVSNDKIKTCEIDLDSFIGCSEKGYFVLGGNNASKAAQSFYLRGTILFAKFPYGELQEVRSVSLNLEFCLIFDEKSESLQFKRPARQVNLSCTNFTLQNGCTLNALCLGKDGALHLSSIELNEHLKIENKSFKLGNQPRDQFLSHGIQGTDSFFLRGLTLYGQIRGRQDRQGYEILEVAFDLSQELQNLDGKLSWSKEWPVLGRDGLLARWTEPIPLLGYITAFVHRLAGNTDHSNGAIAKASGSSVLFAGCLIVSVFTANPIALGIAAAALTPVAIEVEQSIANGTIVDDTEREKFKANASRYLKDAIINSLAGAGAGNHILQALRPRKDMLKEEAKVLFQQSAKDFGSDFVTSNTFAVLASESWDVTTKALEEVQ